MNSIKFRLAPLLTLPLIALLLAGPTLAQDDAIENHPGFVDFSLLTNLVNDEPTVEISLKEPLLNLVTNLIRADDGEAADFISKLLRVTVNVFENSAADVAEISNTMELIAADLEEQSWDRVVRVREDESHVDIYVRLSGDAQLIQGIAVMVAEPYETVLVNIVGDISGNDLAALGRRFDIDELSHLDMERDADRDR